MKNRLKLVVLLLVITLSLLSFTPAVHGSIDVYSLLKLFGIGYVVELLSPQLNDFINTITLNKNIESAESTKVVPILSAGTGGYIGAAQVSGPKEAVAMVEAVAQIEAGYSGEIIRARILVPLKNKNPLKGIQRVPGVGISAIIDIRL